MRYFIVIFGLIMSFATPLYAFGATVEPSASDLTVVPDETAVATISVKNDADLLKNYEITLVQVKFGDQAEEMSFTALSTTLKEALSVAPRLFALEPNSSRTIDVSIRLPANAEAQSPTIAILVTEKGDQAGVGSVQASIASLLFLHVPGQLERSYAIDSFTTLPSFTFGSQTMLSGVFRNDGEETLILPNEIRVFGPFGREVGRGQMSIEPKHLPPDTSRGLTLQWPKDSGFSRLLIGTYRFELWDGDQLSAKASATFLPTGFLVVIGSGLILVLLGIITYVRRRT